MGLIARWTREHPHSSVVQACSGELNVARLYSKLTSLQGPLTIDSFELLKVIGKGSFGKVSEMSGRVRGNTLNHLRSCKSGNATHSESTP